MKFDAKLHASNLRYRASRTHSVLISTSSSERQIARHRLSLCLIITCILLAFLFALVSPAAAVKESKAPATAATEQKVPDVLILVLVTQQMDLVSFAYSDIAKREQVEAHLAALLRETGWTANNISVEDLKTGGSPSTTVQFSTLGTVNLGSGGFPIEPIVKAFRNVRYMEIQFLVNMPFEFRGLREFENKHVKISLKRGTNAYGYSVFIKDPSFKTLDLPIVQTEATAARKPTERRYSGLLTTALIVALGLFVAMLAYFLTKRATGSHSQS